MAKYRYPGAQPFSTAQEQIFFGRERDLEALYRMIRLEPLVVLYSKSGLGKSSLLNAGLVPRVTADGKYRPVKIRFNAYTPGGEGERLPLDAAREAVAAAAESEETTFLEKILSPEDSLWRRLKTEQARAGRPLLLLFDQFEELFTYPAAAVDDFKRQLAELLNPQIPQRFLAAVEREVENPERLTPEELALLHQPFDARIVFAIREDRISLLDKLADYLPDVKRSWYELGALGREQAEDAILNPAYKKGVFVSPVFDYEDEAIEQMLDFLTRGGSQPIESFQLQILCQAIERKVIRQELTVVTAADLGNIEEIYENYYDDQIRLIEDPEEQLAARRFIEEGLIFEEEERRLSLYEGQIFRQYGLSEALLRKLEDTHLIRREPSLKGGYTYELSHDTLVAPVLRAKEQRLAEERRQAAAAERQRREAELAEARRKAEEERQLREKAEQNEKRARQRTRLAVILSLMAILLALFAGVSYRQAKEAEREADASAAQAREATQEAEANLQRALEEEEKAKAALAQLEIEQQATEEQRRRAEENARTAERKTREAEANLRSAVQANERVVLSLLRDADARILALEYEAALDRTHTAAGLEVQKDAVFTRYFELAYWFNESGAPERARGILDTALDYRPRPDLALDLPPQPDRKALQGVLQALDEARYRRMERRYYPYMIDIPGGRFWMGCDSTTLRKAYGEDANCREDETRHEAVVSDYALAETETTFWQFGLYCAAAGRNINEFRPNWLPGGDHPVVNVSWYDAVEYANWLSKQQEKDTVYSGELRSAEVAVDWSKNGFRLPTEAEWEYAARAKKIGYGGEYNRGHAYL